MKTPRRNVASNRFLLGIIRAWDAIISFLFKDKPSTWDELLNQPMLANSLFRDNAGKLLGLQTHLAWGILDNGSTASVRTWTQIQQMSPEHRLTHLQSVHGAKIMTATIATTYSSFFTTFQPSQEHLWFGCFTNDTLMVVKGVLPNGCVSYFEVLDKQ